MNSRDTFDEDGNWPKYRIWVIDTVSRLRSDVDGLRNDLKLDVIPKINDLENKITALQIKSGVWGLIAGMIAALLAILVKGQFS